jgi:hypothetical protein
MFPIYIFSVSMSYSWHNAAASSGVEREVVNACRELEK